MAGLNGVGDQSVRNVFEEEEDDGLDISGIEEARNDEYKWCLVGRFLTEKTVNLTAVKTVLPPIWKPVRGVCITEAGPNLFLFQFFHEMDMKRVLEDGPWTFEFHLFICRQLVVGESVANIQLWDAVLWVHVNDIPLGLVTKKLGENVGNYLGKFICHDNRRVKPNESSSLRVRVSIDVRKPLKKKMKFKRSANTWSWVELQYERIPMFCFYCGIMGHSEKFCDKYFDNPIPKEELPYGADMRYVMKKSPVLMEDRWLRNADTAVVESEVADDEVADMADLNAKMVTNLSIEKSNMISEFQIGGIRGKEDKEKGMSTDLVVSAVTKSSKEYLNSKKVNLAIESGDEGAMESKRKRPNLDYSVGNNVSGPSFHATDMIIDPISYRPAGLDNKAGPKK
ncbi:uncharacterized protein LOC126662073 [Mercurialis annua]|uniref:uncharacterized protein LOC126662073 n=1 Tax=Mercurialis annua TaxID=3986 RepID=UPI00215DF053|nr:uncharacterized protein LOC126662073 [Mercurialis annua]